MKVLSKFIEGFKLLKLYSWYDASFILMAKSLMVQIFCTKEQGPRAKSESSHRLNTWLTYEGKHSNFLEALKGLRNKG